VGLVVGVVWRFNKPIDALLFALRSRIESGSRIKAGPFEISEQLQPLAPEAQRRKAARDLEELVKLETSEESLDTNRAAMRPSALQSRYFQAENLALRAIQAAYGVTIQQQVTAGTDMGFDGAFVLAGRLHVVEVVYSIHRINLQKMMHDIERITSAIRKYGWKNVTIDLVLVAEAASQFDDEQISQISQLSCVRVAIHQFLLDDLRRQFGAEDEDVG